MKDIEIVLGAITIDLGNKDTFNNEERSLVRYLAIKLYLEVIPETTLGYDEVKRVWPGAYYHAHK